MTKEMRIPIRQLSIVAYKTSSHSKYKNKVPPVTIFIQSTIISFLSDLKSVKLPAFPSLSLSFCLLFLLLLFP